MTQKKKKHAHTFDPVGMFHFVGHTTTDDAISMTLRLLDSADLKSRLLKGGFTFAFQWNIKHTPHKKGKFLTLESGDVVRRKS